MYKLYLNKQLIYSSNDREEYYKVRKKLASSNWCKQIFGMDYTKTI